MKKTIKKIIKNIVKGSLASRLAKHNKERYMDNYVKRMDSVHSLEGYVWKYLMAHSLLRKEFIVKELTAGEINYYDVDVNSESACITFEGNDIEIISTGDRRFPHEFMCKSQNFDDSILEFDEEEKGFEKIAEEICQDENRALALIKEKYPTYKKGSLASRIEPMIFNKNQKEGRLIAEVISVIVFK